MPEKEISDFAKWISIQILENSKGLVFEVQTGFSLMVAYFYKYQLCNEECINFLEYLSSLSKSNNPYPNIAILKISI